MTIAVPPGAARRNATHRPATRRPAQQRVAPQRTVVIEYTARPGSHFSDKDAAIIGPILQRIHDRDGSVATGAVVAEARRVSSPIHRYFDWEVEIAATRWWDQQARQMVNSVFRVVPNEAPQRAYWSLAHDDGRSYQSLDSILSDPERVQKVLGQLARDLRAVQTKTRAFRRAAGFEKAEPLMVAIDEYLEQVA